MLNDSLSRALFILRSVLFCFFDHALNILRLQAVRVVRDSNAIRFTSRLVRRGDLNDTTIDWLRTERSETWRMN